uniref:Phosphatidylinositol transfer protein beta isoform n=1 Tax=Cyprinus carpio TaxID=7962 RepID=A0A8C1ZZD9_CYPCA
MTCSPCVDFSVLQLFTTRFLVLFRCLLPKEPWFFMRKPGTPIHTVALNEYMKDDFFIKIETWHKPDTGTTENPHGLPPEEWEDIEIVPIDIADRSQVDDVDYKPEEDPAVYHSEKTGRGPLGPEWKVHKHAIFTCIGKKNKQTNNAQEKRLFTNFHRQLFCWLDRWVDLTMDDIRRMEEETQRELDQMRSQGSVRGMKAGED